MRSFVLSLAFAFSAAFVATTTEAGTISIVDGNSGDGYGWIEADVPAGPLSKGNAQNNFLELLALKGSSVLSERGALDDGRISVSAFFGAQLTSSSSTFHYEFFGSEAKYVNTITVGDQSMSTPGKTGGAGEFSDTPMADFIASSLDFVFTSSGNPTIADNIGLGTNPNNDGTQIDVLAFGAICIGGVGGQDCSEVWLFLDDGGSVENDDYDDMIIRITAMPLPTAAWFLIAGVGGLAYVGRKRKA